MLNWPIILPASCGKLAMTARCNMVHSSARNWSDWRVSDFLEQAPAEVAIVSGFCISPHLRDDAAVVAHMVEASVAEARELGLDHVFFEMCPDLWPLFHRAGLTRKGGARLHRRTGLKTAVFHLDCAAGRVSVPVGGWGLRLVDRTGPAPASTSMPRSIRLGRPISKPCSTR
jgi:hypothetical protein